MCANLMKFSVCLLVSLKAAKWVCRKFDTLEFSKKFLSHLYFFFSAHIILMTEFQACCYALASASLMFTCTSPFTLSTNANHLGYQIYKGANFLLCTPCLNSFIVVYRSNRDTVPLILHLITRWRSVVHIRPWPLYSHERTPYLLNMRLSGLHTRSGRFEEHKISFP
jgi:hypothetical protein